MDDPQVEVWGPCQTKRVLTSGSLLWVPLPRENKCRQLLVYPFRDNLCTDQQIYAKIHYFFYRKTNIYNTYIICFSFRNINWRVKLFTERDQVRRSSFQCWRNEAILGVLDFEVFMIYSGGCFIKQLEVQPNCSATAQEICWIELMLKWVYINSSLWKPYQCKIKEFNK